MFHHKIWAITASLGLLLGAAPNATAMSSMNKQFRHIEQPLLVKVGVGVGGLASIGLELWWFLAKSKPSHTD